MPSQYCPWRFALHTPYWIAVFHLFAHYTLDQHLHLMAVSKFSSSGETINCFTDEQYLTTIFNCLNYIPFLYLKPIISLFDRMDFFFSYCFQQRLPNTALFIGLSNAIQKGLLNNLSNVFKTSLSCSAIMNGRNACRIIRR